MMFPGGMNPRQMQKMMKKMGIQMDELDALQVVINCVDKKIILDDPQVIVTHVQGQQVYQVSGSSREEEVGEVSVTVSDEDVKMVAQQAEVSEGKARKALEGSNGDLAQAILELKK